MCIYIYISRYLCKIYIHEFIYLNVCLDICDS